MSFSLTEIRSADLLNAILVALMFATLIGMAELWYRLGKPPVEWTRKLVHFGGGLVCLLLPFWIESPWIVLILASLMSVVFVVSRRFAWLPCIHGVDRKSHGTVYYPVVILLLFVLSAGQHWQYVICVLVLAVSDSAAALVGMQVGRLRFTVEEEKKSVEGSLAFLVVTFVAVIVPLLIWTPVVEHSSQLTHYLLAATLIGLLVTCMEVIALRGSDNLWVPLGTWLVLTKTFQTDVPDLWIQILSFVVILVCLLTIARTSELLNVGGAMVCCLAAYGLWAMGSLDWALVFFIAFSIYLMVAWISDIPWQIRVRAALYSLVPPVAVLAVANILLNNKNLAAYQALFGPFLAASCVSLGQAISNVAVWKHRKQTGKRLMLAASISFSVSLVVVTVSMYRQAIWDAPGLLLLCLSSTSLVMASTFWLPTLPPGEAPVSWLRFRSGFSLFAAAWIVLIQQTGLCLLWRPA